MIDYNQYPTLKGIYLEDSYVLAIIDEPGVFAFKLEAVLTPEHPRYHNPRPGEQYCYADGYLIFRDVSRVDWLERSSSRSVDAAGDEDLGNIDGLTTDGGAFITQGDWGRVRIASGTQPRFEISA
ncbi:hypothetical protein ACWDTP_21335 [Mycobacterium sp. NPDC003449]